MSSTVRESTIRFLEERDAFWCWNGHKHVAELASGKLSDFYANCTPIFTDPEVQDMVAKELVLMTNCERINDEPNVWVVGSAMGAIGLAQSLAREFVAGAAYTEPVEVPALRVVNETRKVMQLKRFDLGEKPYVILCEDVVTTGGTTLKTIEAIQAKHPDVVFHPKILTIVNRNPGVLLNNLRVTALIEVAPNIWDTLDDLPDNMKGCVPIRPKGNWRKLADEMLVDESDPDEFQMQLGAELRCTNCRAGVDTKYNGADCECENIKVKHVKDPITQEVSAIVTVRDTADAEALRRDDAWVPFLEAIHFGKPTT